jgi:chaperonin GroES
MHQANQVEQDRSTFDRDHARSPTADEVAVAPEPQPCPIEPAGHRVVLRPIVFSVDRTPGGIYIPETSSTAGPIHGTVLAVGNECVRYQVGDTVLFKRYSGTVVEVDKEELTIMDEDEILGWWNLRR